MEQSWAQIRYNSPERAERLLKERRKYRQKMQGTYEEQSADELARINLRMATQLQQQKLANAGQLAYTKEQGASRERAANIAIKPGMARVKETTREWDQGADLRAETVAQSKLKTNTAKAASVYIPELLKQQVNAGRLPAQSIASPIVQAGTVNTTADPLASKNRKKSSILSKLLNQNYTDLTESDSNALVDMILPRR